LSDGFKSGLAEAMNNYATKPNKKDAVDGIQATVCSLSVVLFLSLAFFTARCTTAKRGLAIACRLSVCDVGGSGSHRLEILETNCTDN